MTRFMNLYKGYEFLNDQDNWCVVMDHYNAGDCYKVLEEVDCDKFESHFYTASEMRVMLKCKYLSYSPKEYITMESFGSMCPTNWEEIADKLNEIIDDRIDDPRDTTTVIEEVWEDFCAGKLEWYGVPEAEFDNGEE